MEVRAKFPLKARGVAGVSFRRAIEVILLLCFLALLGSPGSSPAAGRQGGEPGRAEPLEFQATPKRLARGRYLVNGLAHCFMCHSQIDCFHNNCQPVPGKEGSGQVLEAWETGFPQPYRLVEPNITPDRKTGAGSWTDAELVRALRDGIGHDGRALFPVMPYANFRGLTDEDLASIIVYIRSLRPVYHPLPKSRIPPTYPVSSYPFLETPLPPAPPNASPEVRHGAYLVRIGNCSACHTPRGSDRRPLPEMFLAGGQVFHRPWGTSASANLTPDPSGAVAGFTEDMFVRTIQTGRVDGVGRQINQFMPWSYYRNLSDEDLEAIFAYLRAIKPVHHEVDNTEPPTYCCLDKQKHGLGYMNCPPYLAH